MFYNGQIREIGSRHYALHAESDVTLLNYEDHPGGMYTGTAAGTVIADIMSNIPYTIHASITPIKLYGWLPYAKKRENIQQIIMAIGAAITRNANGTMHFTVLNSEIKSSLLDNRVFTEGVLNEDTKVTAVQVTEHAFIALDETITLFSGPLSGQQLVKFTEPAHSLSVTGGTIVKKQC